MNFQDMLVRAHRDIYAELRKTRGHALWIWLGVAILAAAALGEMGNLFNYWRLLAEDAYGELSVTGMLMTIGFSIASFAAFSYAVHCGLERLRGRDHAPPYVSATIGVLSAVLSLLFPLWSATNVDRALLPSLFSLLLTIVAGLGLSMMMGGFVQRTRHRVALKGATALDKGQDEYAKQLSLERTLTDRMKAMEVSLSEDFARYLAAENDAALEVLALGVATDGQPVAPIEGRMQRMIGARETPPEVCELIDLVAGPMAIGLHRRLCGRAMSPNERAAVAEYLAVAPRPTARTILDQLERDA